MGNPVVCWWILTKNLQAGLEDMHGCAFCMREVTEVPCCLLCAGVSVCRSELLVTVAPITLRAAFSNIRTWNILQADMQLAGQVQQLRVIHTLHALQRCMLYMLLALSVSVLWCMLGLQLPVRLGCYQENQSAYHESELQSGTLLLSCSP
jgi:hypothetical protein